MNQHFGKALGHFLMAFGHAAFGEGEDGDETKDQAPPRRRRRIRTSSYPGRSATGGGVGSKGSGGSGGSCCARAVPTVRKG